jgi:bifunctional DNA-binding transcriptional regulator/antitoxin component of YhaV-PrlF toxin-antitoxin module
MALMVGIWQTRDRFGLEPGASLTVDEEGDAILLRPAEAAATVRRKGAALVVSGEIAGDAEGAIRQHRRERIERLTGRPKKTNR